MICMRNKAKGDGRMSENAGALTECGVKTRMTPDHITVQVRRSG